MADIDDANTYMASAGYLDWAALSDAQKNQALTRADTYIRVHYRLRTSLSADEQYLVGLARWLIARDLALELSSGAVAGPLARDVNVTKKIIEAGGVKSETDYAVGTGQIDPYPQITAILAPLVVIFSQANFYSGWQV